MNRRNFILTGANALAFSAISAPRLAMAFGQPTAFDLPLVEYPSPTWNSRPTAIRRILQEIEMTTSVTVTDEPSVIRLSESQTFLSPIAVLGGDRAFDAWTTEQRDVLGAFLRAGGLLYVDSAEGRADGGFFESIAREVAAILPDGEIRDVPNDHVLYRSFYLVDPAPGRVRAAETLQGVFFDERLAVVINHNDVFGAWARDSLGNYEFEMSPGGEAQRAMAQRFGVNLAMYALCLDYKADQVHINYLLRRRRWRVE